MRTQSIISSGLALVAAASAWPSIFNHPADAIDRREAVPLIAVRQDEPTKTSKFNLSYTPPPTSTADDSSDDDNASATSTNDDDNASATSTDDSKSNTSGGSKTTSKPNASGTGSHASSGNKKGTSTTSTGRKSYDPRMGPGGVSMITPNPLSPASYYKIHDYITFAWNYTSISSNPSYIDVFATCTANAASYPIAQNVSFETLQAVTWDTGAYQATGTVPLLTETYTLVIHDAMVDVSATAGAGYLGTWRQFTFGMYSPQPYTPIADFVCATCSAAMSSVEKQTYGFILGMVGVTVLSFGWFGGVAGIW